MSEIVFPNIVRSCCCHAFWWMNKSEGNGASEVLGESCPVSGPDLVNGLNFRDPPFSIVQLSSVDSPGRDVRASMISVHDKYGF